jgi:hypothetical protein
LLARSQAPQQEICMPILAAIVGAITTGVIYWMIWGGGMEYVSQRLSAGSEQPHGTEDAAGKPGRRRRADVPRRP